MDNKQMYAIIVVVVVIVVVAAAAVLLMGGDDSDDTDDDTGTSGSSSGSSSSSDDTSSSSSYTTISVSFAYNSDIRFAIFGNVNGDDYINEEDYTLLEDILLGNATYDAEANCFADTNADGTLDAEDLDLLRNLIEGEECTMYYWAATKSIESISYPLVADANIGVHHMYGIDAMIILGLYYDVVGTSNQTFQNSIATDGIRYPGMGTTIANVGSPWEDCEAAINAGISIWLDPSSSSSRDYTTYKTVAAAAGIDLQVIRLNITTYSSSSSDLYGTLLMFGFMFQCSEEAEEFVEWVDGVRDYISEATAGANSDWTFITPYLDDGVIELDTTYTDGSMMGDVYSISLTGMTSVNTVVDSGCPEISLEEIYNIDPDVIFVIQFSTSTKSVEEVQEAFEEEAATYQYTRAYENGNVYGVNYYNLASYAGASELVLLASYIWPDYFDEDVGWEYLQYYYDNFTMYEDVDVSTMGNAIPYKLSS